MNIPKRCARLLLLSCLLLAPPRPATANADDAPGTTTTLAADPATSAALASAGAVYSYDRAEMEAFLDEEFGGEEPRRLTPDPIRPVNRGFFNFNDALYYWLARPAARCWKFIFPQFVRIGFRNMYQNIKFPVRFVNCFLQGKFRSSGNECVRFVLNSTIGLLGFFDVAKSWLHIIQQDEDFGQTMARWGVGEGFFITIPFLGPSNLRDFFGLLMDLALNPGTYSPIPLGIINALNNTSLNLGQYESLTESAIDPYQAVRDAWVQNRRHEVRK